MAARSLRDWLQNEDNIAGFGTEYPQTPALGATLLITLAKTKYTLSLERFKLIFNQIVNVDFSFHHANTFAGVRRKGRRSQTILVSFSPMAVEIGALNQPYWIEEYNMTRSSTRLKKFLGIQLYQRLIIYLLALEEFATHLDLKLVKPCLWSHNFVCWNLGILGFNFCQSDL